MKSIPDRRFHLFDWSTHENARSPRAAVGSRWIAVVDSKDAGAVDSRYLYHPMLNLGNLALDGDDVARALFLKSIDFGTRAARHFKYRWPPTDAVRPMSAASTHGSCSRRSN